MPFEANSEKHAEHGAARRPGPHSLFARHCAVGAAPARELFRSGRAVEGSVTITSLSTLGEPFVVAIADAYGDGVVWFAIDGADDRFALVYIDGRADSPTRNRLFDGAKHPKRGGQIIDLGAREEGIVISLVSKWLDSAEPRELGLTDFGWELIRDSLLRYGEPIVEA